MKNPKNEINFEVFKRNYKTLDKCYRLGEFETDRLPGFHFQEEPSAICPMKDAALELYAAAKRLEKNFEAGSDEFNLLWRARSQTYEIADYFFAVTVEMENEFIKFVELSNNDLKELIEEVLNRQMKIPDEYIKAFYLAFISGINVLYKIHSRDGYVKAETAVRRFYKLPSILSEEKLGIQMTIPKSIFALAKYLEGKILSAQGKESEEAFLESIDLYAESLYEVDKIQSATDKSIFEKRVMTIRRMTIASAFGIGYGFLVKSELKQAFHVLSQARAITKHFAGKVFAAYAEYLYRRTKRAKESSSRMVLSESIVQLEECLKIFACYVPTSDYISRTEIELALCEYYLAKLEEEKNLSTNKKLSNKAKLRLERIVYADKAKSVLNNHSNSVLSEALAMLSYITWYNDNNLGEAEKIADLAVSISEGTQYYCEALLARGSCCYHKAQLKKGTIKGIERKNKREDIGNHFKEHYENALDYFYKALSCNIQKNPRIAAIAHLKLVELNLLQSETFPLASFHFKEWQAIEDKVEHAFIREKAIVIQENFRVQNKAYLFVSLDEGIGLEAWQKEVSKFLVNQVLCDLANDYNEGIITNTQYKAQIAHALQDKLQINRSTAYNWIQEANLIKKLQNLLRN